MQRILLLVLFFLSGIAALIYQVVWVRQATLVFGVSVYAYGAVLAAFMGGAALGSYLLGKRADAVKSPLRIFALLQICVALLGVLAPLALTALMPFYASLARDNLLNPFVITGVRALFSILVLTPPAFFIGAALPFMARAFARQPGQVGSDVGRLYAADTLGAALGCGLAGLVLLPRLGASGTILVAVWINGLTAATAWMVARRYPIESAKTKKVKTLPKTELSTPNRPATPILFERMIPGFVLVAYTVSGFIALGYEVVWARILSIFTMNAVFSFSIMLTTFLMGLTVGGWLGAAWVRKRRVTLMHFANGQLAIGLTALLTLYVFAWLPDRVTIETVFGAYSVTNGIFFEFLLGFLTLFIPTTLLGFLFPVVISLYTQESSAHVGTQVGRIYAWNTAGAVAGSLTVGFVLIPLLGLQATAATLSVLNLIIGVMASWLPSAEAMHSRLIPQAGMALGIALILLLPEHYYLGFRQGATDQMVYYGEGAETTVAVFDIPEEDFKVSFVNGRIEVPTDPISMRAFRLLGHLPPLLKPDAARALMLSFGNGVATGSLDTHQVAQIDAVDLSAEQFAAAEFYWAENYNVLKSPRLHTFVEDGRNFLLQTPFQYDIITTDATHPVNASSWALFTQEFYILIAARLTSDGVFMQWLPFHNLREEDYKAILRTFQLVFPHATLWYTGGSHTLLLATPEPLTQERLAAKLVAAADNQIVIDDLGSAATIAKDWVMDADALRVYAGQGRLVTDNNAFFLPHAEDTAKILQMFAATQQER